MAESLLCFRAEQEYYLQQHDFMINLTVFLEQNHCCGALLALLEAGRSLNGATSNLLAAIEDYPPQQYSVLIEDSDRLENVAPYLINLGRPVWAKGRIALTGFADWLFNQEDFSRLGVFFVSSIPFLQVKLFWQRFSYARFHDNKKAYFRFYNPRFFDSLMRNLGKKEYQNISSVVEMILYFDYFNPLLVHVYHFYAEGYRIEQYDLQHENGIELVKTLFAGR